MLCHAPLKETGQDGWHKCFCSLFRPPLFSYGTDAPAHTHPICPTRCARISNNSAARAQSPGSTFARCVESYLLMFSRGAPTRHSCWNPKKWVQNLLRRWGRTFLSHVKSCFSQRSTSTEIPLLFTFRSPTFSPPRSSWQQCMTHTAPHMWVPLGPGERYMHLSCRGAA